MNKKEKKAIKAQAKQFINEKRGYTTPEEKKAFRLALKERRKAWRKRLETLDAPQRAAELKKARCFWAAVYGKQLLILAALLFAALLLIILLILL